MPCTEAYKEHIMYTFNGYCKTVIRFAAINAWRDRSRRRQKEINTLRMTAPGQYEAEINGRGTYFHVIAGRHKYGSFLCIPNHGIGCELADFSDIRWTIGRLCMHPIRKVDAVTVAAGISHLEKAAASG